MYTLYTWARTSWPAVTRPVATRSEASLVTGTLTSPAFLARLVSITLYSRLSKLIFSTSAINSLSGVTIAMFWSSRPLIPDVTERLS